MKNAKIENRKENRKIVKAAQSRREAGVPVRSGVKAGFIDRDPRQRFTHEHDIGV